MRNFTLIVLILVPIGIFCQEKPLVVATASIFADMAENIGGGEVVVKSIVPIGADPHTHEPTPADARLVQSADLIIKNGLTFEGWLNELIENSGSEAEIALITEGIDPIQSIQYANSTDPHAWMSAKKGLTYIENIKNALARLVPEHQEMFEFNFGVYRQQLADLDESIHQKISTIPEEKRILITSHDAFRYYANEYGIRVESILGTSTDADIQTSDIIRLNKVIKSSNIPAVFIESTVNPKDLELLAKDNNIVIGGKLYADSIGEKDSPAPTYLDMLEYNTNTIVNGLTMARKSSKEDEVNSYSKPSSTGLFAILLGVLLLGGFFLVFRMVK